MEELRTLLPEKIASNVTARGLSIIVTNDYTSPDCLLKNPEPLLSPLYGTKKDGESMAATFNQIGFVVHWKHNITSTELTQLIYEATSFENYHMLKKYKCIVFIFSGHGDLGDFIYLQDGSKMSISEEILGPFLPKSSPNMGRLQKLFFFDACRGKEEMKTVMVPRSGSSKGKCDPAEPRGAKVIERIRVPAEGGFLVAFSTMPRYQAWEEEKGGAWLQRLAKKIRDSKGSIEDVLTQVNKELVERESYQFAQQPEKLSRLNEIIYLHPDRDVTNPEPEKKKPLIAAVFPPASSSSGSQDTASEPASTVAQGISYDGCQHYQELMSQYDSAIFSDYPHIPAELKIPYYRSTVSVSAPNSVHPIIGDSGRYFVSVQLARNEAAKDVLLKLQANSAISTEQMDSSSFEQVATSNSLGGYPAQTYTQPDSSGLALARGNVQYLQQMNTFFQKNGIRPQFEFQSDSSGGPTRHRCTVRYTLNGQQKKVDSGHFYLSKSDAKEQVAKRVLSKENSSSVVSKGAVGATPPSKVWKSKLKEYCDRITTDRSLKPNYSTVCTLSGNGFVSTVTFLGREQSGEACKSKTEAEHSAAQHALHSV